MKTNIELKVPFKAYKVFNMDWTCRGFKFEVGKEYKENSIKICEKGFHACLKLYDCFNYYDFNPNNKVAEVIILGDFELHNNDSKVVTNYIKIEKELTWYEVLDLCNSGYGNSGYGNSGYGNSGDENSGDENSGDENSGNRNSGYGNSGNRNSGHGNSGNRNSGHGNSGNRNSGNRNSGDGNSGYGNSGYGNSGYGNSGYGNSGDGNSCNYSNGVFNSINNKKINMFNKKSNWTIEDWKNSNAYNFYNITLTEWVLFSEMTKEEKEKYPDAETLNGYLKTYDYKEAHINWWSTLTEEQKQEFYNLPNFDKDVWFEITGIRVE